MSVATGKQSAPYQLAAKAIACVVAGNPLEFLLHDDGPWPPPLEYLPTYLRWLPGEWEYVKQEVPTPPWKNTYRFTPVDERASLLEARRIVAEFA